MTTYIAEKIFCLRLSMTKSARSAKSFWIFRFLAKPQYDNIFRHCEQMCQHLRGNPKMRQTRHCENRFSDSWQSIQKNKKT
ncbi:hypothetical protein CQA40_09670 [Helicobacter sp. MIT 01-3238]|nr:hypothetical protein CQA40_09670 [Helicobacter sp. MIT 01-3238]